MIVSGIPPVAFPFSALYYPLPLLSVSGYRPGVQTRVYQRYPWFSSPLSRYFRIVYSGECSGDYTPLRLHRPDNAPGSPFITSPAGKDWLSYEQVINIIIHGNTFLYIYSIPFGTTVSPAGTDRVCERVVDSRTGFCHLRSDPWINNPCRHQSAKSTACLTGIHVL